MNTYRIVNSLDRVDLITLMAWNDSNMEPDYFTYGTTEDFRKTCVHRELNDEFLLTDMRINQALFTRSHSFAKVRRRYAIQCLFVYGWDYVGTVETEIGTERDQYEEPEEAQKEIDELCRQMDYDPSEWRVVNYFPEIDEVT